MIYPRWLPPMLWAFIILVVTSVPESLVPGPRGIPHLDKAVHMFLYAVLGWLVASALMTDRPPLWLRTWIVTVAAIALFGAADEWHQAFVPGRSSDLRDLVADVSGAAMGASAAIVLLRRNQST